MRRQHIVVGRDNADVGAIHHFDDGLVVTTACCDAVGEISTAQLTSMNGLGGH